MRLVRLLAMAVLLAACSSSGQPGGTAQPAATAATGQSAAAVPSAIGTQTTGGGGGGGGGGSLLDRAKAVQHFCDLLPTDLAAGIVPNAPPPQEEQFPPRCSVYGDKTAMEISLDAFVSLGDRPAGAETVSGLGTGAYLEHLAPGNFYLSIGLSADGGVLHVEVNNQDGKDHKDEAVNVARAVLQKLGG